MPVKRLVCYIEFNNKQSSADYHCSVDRTGRHPQWDTWLSQMRFFGEELGKPVFELSFPGGEHVIELDGSERGGTNVDAL
jgi:hypothetical protein